MVRIRDAPLVLYQVHLHAIRFAALSWSYSHCVISTSFLSGFGVMSCRAACAALISVCSHSGASVPTICNTLGMSRYELVRV